MSRHHRHHGRNSRFAGFLRPYSFEIIAAVVVVLGILLVLEQMNIRSALFRWATIGTQNALHAIGHVDEALVSFAARASLSDILGLVLIGVSAVTIVFRIRWRLVRTTSLTTLCCPRCRGSIHRVHRRLGDRVVSWFVPVRRYRCSSRECRWCGIRVAASKHGPEATISAQ